MFVVNNIRREIVLAFETMFDDGTAVATENSWLPSALPTRPLLTRFWLPDLRNPRQLYLVHDQARDSLGFGKMRLAIGKDPVAFLSAGTSRVNIHRVESGYYFLDETNCVYRLTWKGAFLMTCRFFRSTKPFYRAWRRRQSRNLLRKLGVRLDVD